MIHLDRDAERYHCTHLHRLRRFRIALVLIEKLAAVELVATKLTALKPGRCCADYP